MDRSSLLRLMVVVALGTGFCAALACDDGDGDGDADGDVDGDVDTDVDGDADGDADGDVDTDVDTDADGDADGDADEDVESGELSCAGLITCLSECGNDLDCLGGCGPRLCPAHEDLWDAVDSCVAPSCGELCGADRTSAACLECVNTNCGEELGACTSATSCPHAA